MTNQERWNIAFCIRETKPKTCILYTIGLVIVNVEVAANCEFYGPLL